MPLTTIVVVCYWRNRYAVRSCTVKQAQGSLTFHLRACCTASCSPGSLALPGQVCLYPRENFRRVGASLRARHGGTGLPLRPHAKLLSNKTNDYRMGGKSDTVSSQQHGTSLNGALSRSLYRHPNIGGVDDAALIRPELCLPIYLPILLR